MNTAADLPAPSPRVSKGVLSQFLRTNCRRQPYLSIFAPHHAHADYAAQDLPPPAKWRPGLHTMKRTGQELEQLRYAEVMEAFGDCSSNLKPTGKAATKTHTALLTALKGQVTTPHVFVEAQFESSALSPYLYEQLGIAPDVTAQLPPLADLRPDPGPRGPHAASGGPSAAPRAAQWRNGRDRPRRHARVAGLPMVERVVFDSPIPMNEEQRKVLLATRDPNGKIIVVSGPPGTGKSHTINAIAADCAFTKRSCLILSDKTEALDVVWDKLNEAMSRVRHDRDFPNPILRLGQQAANFKRLTSNQVVTQVGAYARAMRANRPRLESEREGIASSLKGQIDKTVKTLGGVHLATVQAMHVDEQRLTELAPGVMDVLHRCTDAKYLPELEAAAPHLDALQAYLEGVFAEGDFTPASLWDRVRRDATLAEFAPTQPMNWDLFEALDAGQIRQISSLVLAYDQLRMPVFGYLFRGGQVRELERQLNQLPTTRPLTMKDNAGRLQGIVAAGNHPSSVLV